MNRTLLRRVRCGTARQIIEAACDLGCELVENKAGHIVVQPPTGRPVVVSRNGDRRAALNLRADLRRAGVEIGR